MVRLKDIAERAGVSVMTVSKVLRDAPDISPATKTRIRRLAEEMGYVPDSLAQGLRSKTTRLLGLVMSAMTNPIFARATMAIEEKAYELGYEVLFAHTLNLPEREEICIRRFLSRRVDGLLVSPVYRLGPVAPIYEELRRAGTPTLILGPKAPFCQNFTNVESDDVAGSYAATHHLIQLGHRKIAFLGGPTVAPWSQERLEGYRRAFREAQWEVDDRYIFTAGSTIEDGTRTAQQVLEECPEVTAVQAAQDLVAIGAGNYFLNRGLRIPEDISLVGFGNILSSEYFRVPMTTVRQPKHRLGLAAVEVLQKLLRGESTDSQRLPTELIIRASTGEPRAK